MKSCRSLVLVSVLLLSSVPTFSQNSVGIGTENSNSNAVLELVSPTNNQGFLVPRLSTAQRTNTSFINNLDLADNGLMVFDSDEKKFYFWHDNAWLEIKSGAEYTAGTGISIANGQIINTGDTDPTDDFDGNFSSLSGVPADIADGDNVDDADADPLNEIQDLNLSGNTLIITNNPSASPIDLAPFSGTNTDNQTLGFSTNQLSITGGNTVDLSGLIDDADANPNNELQTLSLTGSNLSLSSGGGTVTVFSGDFNDLINIPTNLDTDASDDFDGAFSSLSGIPTGISDGDDVDDADNSPTNELQSLGSSAAGTNRTITISGGTGTTFNVADNDNNSSNELQAISRSGNNLTLSSGGTVKINDQVAFKAYKNAENLTQGKETVITFENSSYDLQNNQANGEFTAPFNGIYHFCGVLTLTRDTGTDANLSFYLNGSFKQGLSLTSQANTHSYPFSVDFQLKAGDKVLLTITSNLVATTLEGNAGKGEILSFWSGWLLINQN